MSTAAINPKGARKYAVGAGPLAWNQAYLGSSVGQKILVALTGAGLVTFLVFHMIGNLKMFSGRESINAYASFLKHDLGAIIWIARAGLLGMFALHLFLAIRLQLRAKAARPIGYAVQKAAQANPASTSMLWTGIVILAFTVFHLAHYTFCVIHPVELPDGSMGTYFDLRDAKGEHDVYAMVIAGFSTWWISAIYLVCQVLLFVHLSHGIPSCLRTLGLTGRRFEPAAKILGNVVAGIILLGNFAIVLGVWTNWLEK